MEYFILGNVTRTENSGLEKGATEKAGIIGKFHCGEWYGNGVVRSGEGTPPEL